MPIKKGFDGGRYWDPSYPFGVPKDPPLDPVSEDVGKWELAPATSHCWGFRYVDARGGGDESRLARRYGSLDKGYGKGDSVLYVRFKDEGSGGVAAEYKYFFSDHDAGAAVFEELKAAAHPYGAVVVPRLIKGGVPYQRAS